MKSERTWRARTWLILLVGSLLLAGATARAEDLSPVQLAKSEVQAARLELSCGHLDSATAKLTKASTLQPHWIVPHQWMAVTYQRQGDQEKAIAEYTLVQRLNYGFSPSGRVNPPVAIEKVLAAEALSMWLVNQTRQQNQLPILRPEPLLSLAAREHSLEMRDLAYFDHYSPTPAVRAPLDRFREVFHFMPRCIAENIARRWGTTYCLTPEAVAQTHQDFMNSPGHRANILLDGVASFGMGVAVNEQGHFWISEEFALYGDDQ
ncbi:MAG TPA: CAP domain-containing protein [Armatimonadota bacterium]